MNLEKGYAYALYELQKKHDLSADASVSRLIKVLKKRGHIKLLPSLLSEYEKILNEGRNTETITLTCAKENDFLKYKNKIEEHLGLSDAKFTKEVVDQTIVGGYIIENKETVVDGSYKKKLLLLYKNAIA